MGKPKIRFKGFDNDWEQRKLSDIAVLTSSKRVHAEDYVETGVPFYRGKEISELKEHKPISEVLYITEYKYNEISSMYGSPKEGDLLITAVGTLGNTWVIDQTPFYFKDGNLIWFKDIKCNPKYLDYAMSTADGQKKILASAIGSNQKALTMVKLNELEFMFPGKAEQDKIAEYFSYLDNLITLHQRKCEETKKMKKYMLQKMFPQNGSKVPEIRFKGFTDDWEQRKLGDSLMSLQNNTLSRADLSNESGVAKNVHYGDVLIKFGEVLDISKEQLQMITDERVLSKYKASFLQNGDVIVADTAEDSTVGKCSEIVGLNDEVVLSGLHTIPYRPVENFASGYLGYYLNSDTYHNQLIPLMQGIKVTSISKSAMQDTDIFYPKSIEEQGKISNYLQSLDHLITLHQNKCEELKKIKKYMLQNMFV